MTRFLHTIVEYLRCIECSVAFVVHTFELVPATDSQSSDKPVNDKTRQGETPHGAALPP